MIVPKELKLKNIQKVIDKAITPKCQFKWEICYEKIFNWISIGICCFFAKHTVPVERPVYLWTITQSQWSDLSICGLSHPMIYYSWGQHDSNYTTDVVLLDPLDHPHDFTICKHLIFDNLIDWLLLNVQQAIFHLLSILSTITVLNFYFYFHTFYLYITTEIL
jgi:hypothetical protein